MNSEAMPHSMEQLWEAATGKNSGYYVKQFSRIREKGGVALSWHWPAFWIGALWFLYRRMYLLAILAVVGGVVIQFLVRAAGGTDPASFATTVALMVVAGVAANTLYLRHITARIGRTAAAHPQAADQIEVLRSRRPTHSALLIGIVLLVAVFGLVSSIVGPAYRDYTVRSQVLEGFGLASSVRASMAQFRAREGRWPQDEVELAVADASGEYVASVQISGPSLVITYGNAADPLIEGKSVEFVAEEDAAGAVSWRCGFAGSAKEPVRRTTVMPRFLPAVCRPS